jgi:hypothetical protein
MLNSHIYSFSLILVLFFSQLTLSQTQYDYDAFPDVPLDFIKLSLHAELNPEEALISGRAEYESMAMRSGITSFILNSRDCSIQSVVSEGNDLDFEVRNDSILISLPDTLEKGESFNFEIIWQSQSIYGFHTNREGLMWASTMPLSNRNWLPGFDHPSNELMVDATYTVPESFFVAANGKLVSDEIIVGESKKEISWQSGVEIPFTSIGFAAGNLISEEIRVGLKKIRLLHSASVDSVDYAGILESSRGSLRQLEEELGQEYPFESLNILLLDDRYGDSFDLTAGLVFLKRDEITENTLKAKIAAQWLGVDLQASNTVEYLKIVRPFAEYKSQSITHQSDISEPARFVFSVLDDFLMREENRIIRWEEVALLVYQEFGYWLNEMPDLSSGQISKPGDMQVPDLLEQQYYLASFKLNPDNTELTLIMTSNVDKTDSLHTATLYEYVFGDTLRTEFSFSGSSDTLTFDVSPNLEYALIGRSDADVRVFESKPIRFWLAQLRSQDAGLRQQAASGLVSYADDPDLQLALNDVLQSEENPAVQAAIYTTLSAITSGDIGTEQTFLPLLRRESRELQLAGADALAAYPGNDEVAFALRNKILRTDDDEIFNAAFYSFIEVSDSAEVLSLLDRLTSTGIQPSKFIYLLDRVRPMSSDSAVIERLLPFTGSEFETDVRLMALENVSEMELSQKAWDDLVASLIRDPHPLIRQMGYKLTKKCSPEQAEALRAEIELNEFDIRVTGGSY